MYKPSSVISRKKPFVIYLEHTSPYVSSNLPPDLGDEHPTYVGVFDLTTHDSYNIRVTPNLVGSYPTFSPLPTEVGGYFLLRSFTLTSDFPLGSMASSVARTFL